MAMIASCSKSHYATEIISLLHEVKPELYPWSSFGSQRRSMKPLGHLAKGLQSNTLPIEPTDTPLASVCLLTRYPPGPQSVSQIQK